MIMKIALSGIAGSGKDYLANHLVKESSFKRFAFGDELKKLTKMIYPYLQEDYEPFEKETPLNIDTGFEVITKTPREIWLTVNKLREVENLMFIRMTHYNIQDYLNYKKTNNRTPRVIITDVRTLEEFDYCQEQGFDVIHIEPSKKIYEPNEFDKQILQFKDECHQFFNDFECDNALRKFATFVQHVTKINEN